MIFFVLRCDASHNFCFQHNIARLLTISFCSTIQGPLLMPPLFATNSSSCSFFLKPEWTPHIQVGTEWKKFRPRRNSNPCYWVTHCGHAKFKIHRKKREILMRYFRSMLQLHPVQTTFSLILRLENPNVYLLYFHLNINISQHVQAQ